MENRLDYYNIKIIRKMIMSLLCRYIFYNIRNKYIKEVPLFFFLLSSIFIKFFDIHEIG